MTKSDARRTYKSDIPGFARSDIFFSESDKKALRLS